MMKDKELIENARIIAHESNPIYGKRPTLPTQTLELCDRLELADKARADLVMEIRKIGRDRVRLSKLLDCAHNTITKLIEAGDIMKDLSVTDSNDLDRRVESWEQWDKAVSRARTG